MKLLDHDIRIKRAKEPRNYIWENMAFTSQYLAKRTFRSLVGLGAVLALCYYCQYQLQYQTVYLGQFETGDCQIYKDSVPSMFRPTDI